MALAGNPPADPPRTPHVVHYLQHLREEEGGVVRSVLDLSQALAANGCRVTLLTTDPGNMGENRSDGALGPQVELVDLPRPLFGKLSPEASERLETLLRSATALHLHTIWDPHNLQMAAIARRAGTPYVVSTHGMLDDFAFNHKRTKKQLYLAAVGKNFLRGAYSLHATAEGEARQVRARVTGAKVVVAPLAFDMSEYKALPGPKVAESKFECFGHPGPKLLFLARLHPIKGPELMIEAVAQLPAEHDWHVVMAGPGEEEYVDRLKQLARDRGVLERLSFVGMVSGELKRSLYQACDLYVSPTEQENFGMVYPEALACGLPIVTTETVDTAEELRRAGVTLVPRRAEAFTRAICESLADLEALRTHGQRGREYVFEWLDAERVAAQYVEMYRNAAKSC